MKRLISYCLLWLEQELNLFYKISWVRSLVLREIALEVGCMESLHDVASEENVGIQPMFVSFSLDCDLSILPVFLPFLLVRKYKTKRDPVWSPNNFKPVGF